VEKAKARRVVSAEPSKNGGVRIWTPPDAWSWSRLAAYEECPYAFALRTLDKREVPQSPAMKRGDDIHIEAEGYVKRKVRALPKSLIKYRDEFRLLIKQRATAEENWAFTNTWDPTGWFKRDGKPSPWLRVKTDAHVALPRGVIKIIDYKSGQVRVKEDQLKLYGTAGFAMFEGVKIIIAAFWFLDWHVTVERRYTIDQYGMLKKMWERRVMRMMNDTRFDPTPGNHCRWCHFRKSNGGPCKF
jgi:hypothetical protein